MIEYKKMIVVDKVFKITLCLMLVFIFTIMKPKQEAEAAVPILGWVVGVIGGLVVDVAINQGVKFVDKKSETTFKMTVVNKVWSQYSDEIKKLTPSKVDVLKWAFKAPKWLMLVIVDAVADTIDETKKQGQEREKINSEWGGGSANGAGAGRKFGPSEKLPSREYVTDLEPTNPYYKTDIEIFLIPPSSNATVNAIEGYNYFVKYGKIIVTPYAYEQKNRVQICIGDIQCQGKDISEKVVYLKFVKNNSNTFSTQVLTSNVYYDDLSDKYFGGIIGVGPYDAMYPAWVAYKKILSEQGRKVFDLNGTLVLDLPRQVLSIPDNTKIEVLEKIQVPSIYTDKEIIFDVPPAIIPEFELLPKGEKFDWSLLETFIGDDYYQVTYNYDYSPTINNYYMLPPEVIEEVERDILLPVEKDADKPNELDGSFNQYIKNFYNYFADGIITSIEGFKQLNSSVNSIFSVFGNYFTFLPIEFRTLFFSGASMSVLLGVLYWGRR